MRTSHKRHIFEGPPRPRYMLLELNRYYFVHGAMAVRRSSAVVGVENSISWKIIAEVEYRACRRSIALLRTKDAMRVPEALQEVFTR